MPSKVPREKYVKPPRKSGRNVGKRQEQRYSQQKRKKERKSPTNIYEDDDDEAYATHSHTFV